MQVAVLLTSASFDIHLKHRLGGSSTNIGSEIS